MDISLPLGARLWLAGEVEAPKGLVLIFPGGGYEWLSPREAEPVAAAFVRGGWQAAVLYYNTRTGSDQPPLGDLPLRQAAEAMETLGARFPGRKIVLCGFSAGGNLAGCCAAHWRTLNAPRPDGLILGYPVATMGEFTHPGTRENLLGGSAADAELARFSVEKNVTGDMPPVFCWHTVTDPDVPVQNSLLLAQALSAANIPYELHLYPRGVHGLSLATPEVEEPEKNRWADAHIAGWFPLCLEWLEGLGEKSEKE